MGTQWAKDAPPRLIRAYEQREIRNGRVLLGRLLGKDSDWIESPWTELGRHVRTDEQWLRVWTAIAYAKSKSNKVVRLRHTRSDERDHYQELSRKFGNLANKIENGPLDVLTYELWNSEDWAALHAADLSKMAAMERCDAAFQILRHWPSAPDLLRGLEQRALMLARDAMRKPRPDARGKGDVEGRAFLWNLAEEFRLIFGKRMLGTLATIANVTFNRVEKGQQFSKSSVQSVLRGV
jgi:hypothetical protein